MKEARSRLVIIDSYADKTLLDMISKIKLEVILITKQNNKLTKTDIDKYNSEYHNLNIIYNDTFHDRYLILDHKIIYHLGSSINHAGKRTFSINRLEDIFIKGTLLNYVDNCINM